jgi:hypothetical protein
MQPVHGELCGGGGQAFGVADRMVRVVNRRYSFTFLRKRFSTLSTPLIALSFETRKHILSAETYFTRGESTDIREQTVKVVLIGCHIRQTCERQTTLFHFLRPVCCLIIPASFAGGFEYCDLKTKS